MPRFVTVYRIQFKGDAEKKALLDAQPVFLDLGEAQVALANALDIPFPELSPVVQLSPEIAGFYVYNNPKEVKYDNPRILQKNVEIPGDGDELSPEQRFSVWPAEDVEPPPVVAPNPEPPVEPEPEPEGS